VNLKHKTAAGSTHPQLAGSATLHQQHATEYQPQVPVICHTCNPLADYNNKPLANLEPLQNPGMTGEGSGKLLSHLSSKSTGSNPSSTISLACGGINDATFCPDGGRLAVACRDGSVRLLEWPSGACLGGYQVG
jgi:hypothetical protein